MTAALRDRHCEFVLIGAAALAAHGVARSTRDLDFLTMDRRCLDRPTWIGLSPAIAVDIRTGDAADPLAGVVRFTAPGESPIDLIVGRHAWQTDIVRRARTMTVAGADIAVATRADLIVLKLYAGGPQDAWDIEQLLAADDDVTVDVEARLRSLPDEARALWARIRRPR